MRYLILTLLILIGINSNAQQEPFKIKFKELLNSLEESPEPEKKIPIYKNIIVLSFPDNLDLVNQYSKELLKISLELKDKSSEGFANLFLGKYFFEKENFIKSNEYYLVANDIFNQLKDTLKIANVSHSLGLTNHYLNNYNKALSYYQKSIELNEIKEDRSNAALSYQGIGTLYNEIKKYSLAQYYYDKALQIYKNEGNTEKIAAIFQNMGVLHYNWGNFNESLNFYKKSLKEYENLNDKRNIATSLSNIGLVYEENKHYEEALEYYQKALIILEEIDSKQMLVYIFYNLGSIYRNLKEYKRSIEFFEKGAILSSEIKMKDYISYNYEALSAIYEETGNFKKALQYYKEYNFVKDSIFNEEKFEQIQILETEFQNSENQKQIEYLELDKKLKTSQLKKKEFQNQALIFSSVLGFIIVLILLLFNRYQKKISLKLYNEVEERKKKEYQLNLVKEELGIRVKERTIDLERINEKLLNEVEDHKKTMKKLQLAKHKIEEADKLKSNFLANMSHEVRTPMNAITGFSQMLAYDNLSVDKRREYISLIKEGCKDLTNLIEDIVDFATIDSGEVIIDKKDFNPHPMMEFLLDHYTNELIKREKDHISLIYVNENIDNDLIINTDPAILKQILSIFIDNAIKFTDNGYVQFGFIHLGTNKIQFYVKDTGIGIDKKHSELIFERFRQVDESITKNYGGAGIGLSVAEDLIKILNGKLWFDSVIGKGSTFYIEINSDLAVQNDKFIQPVQFNWSNKTILVAEDKKINFDIIKETLEETSVKLVWAKNGQEAINYIKSNNIVDLILMDIQMPVIDGFEATRQIKKLNNKIPIIAQTAYALPQDRFKCIDAGCDDYISKPISLDNFLLKLSKYLS